MFFRTGLSVRQLSDRTKNKKGEPDVRLSLPISINSQTTRYKPSDSILPSSFAG